MSKHPECNKLRIIAPRSQAIGEFLDWLQDRGVVLAKYHNHSASCYDEGVCICGLRKGNLERHRYNIQDLLAEFFSIDLAKVEAEKQAILDEVRRSE